LSGGKAKVDPIHQPIPSQKNVPVKPKRIEVDANGRKWYFYDCANCGKEFKTKRLKKYKNAYCGEDCRKTAFGKLGASTKGEPRSEKDKKMMSDGQKKKWQDEKTRQKRIDGMRKNPRGKDKKKRASRRKEYPHSCAQCGRTFKNSRKEAKYCSRKCSSEAQKRGKNHTCAHPDCNKQFYLKPSKEDRKYCSPECAKSDPAWREKLANTHKERYGRSWELPGWTEKPVYPQTWPPMAAKMREKDGYQCQSCDKEWKKGQDKFPVHHILPRSLGGPDEEWNLITLCPSCHPKTDKKGGPVRYPFESQTRLPDFGQSEEESGPF